MSVAWRLAFGLVIVTVLASLAQYFVGNRIAAGVFSNVSKEANEQGADWARVLVAGRDVILTGAAPDEAQKAKLGTAIAEVYGVRRVEDRARLLPQSAPYEWKLSREGNNVTFAGAIPSQRDRLSAQEEVNRQVSTAKWRDNAQLARGAPDNLSKLHEFAAAILSYVDMGSVTASDQKLSAEGVAASPEAFSALQGLLAQAPPGVTIVGAKIAPATVTPYVFTARSTETGMVLTGLAPGLKENEELLGLLRAASLTPVTGSDLRFGTPLKAEPNWAANRAVLIGLLAKLKDAKLSITDGHVEFSGLAPGVFEREQILAALAKLPAELRLEKIEISLPELEAVDNLLPALPAPAAPVFSDIEPTAVPDVTIPLGIEPAQADFDDVAVKTNESKPASPPSAAVSSANWQARHENGRLVLSGNAIAALKESAVRLFSIDAIKDETSAGSSLTLETVETLQRGLDYLARLEEGRLASEEGKISLSGRASTTAIRDEILAALSNTPRASGEIDIALTAPVPPPPASPHRCQGDIDQTERSGVIGFATGKAELNPDSVARLNAVAEILKRCADAKAEISGHTDNQGDAADNRELSQRRAQAVLDWLVKADIAVGRISARGYGDTQPRAGNDTAEGRAKNRRIEFKLY